LGKEINSSRVLLSKKVQKQLCLAAKNKLGLAWAGLANYLGVSSRALENWYRGERLLPERRYHTLLNLAGITIKERILLPENWGRVKGGKSIMRRFNPLISPEVKRKTILKIIASNKSRAKTFPLPSFSNKLAEFVGIMLGDGGISTNQISITLGYKTDYLYVPYVLNLIKCLFNLDASVHERTNVFVIRICGIHFVENLLKIGLINGNKIQQQFDIPKWIMLNHFYMRAYIRGLIDTDGCVFKKNRRGPIGVEYRSIGIKFTSASEPLLLTLINMFTELGFKVARSKRDLYISGKIQIFRYVKEIGFSNPKHSSKFQHLLQDYGWVKITTKIV
jgi:intein/homing endonuclease